MTNTSAQQPLSDRTSGRPTFLRDAAPALATLGIFAALVGIIVGIVRAAHSITVECPDGHYTPAGGDPNCYSYPNLGDGLSFALISLILLVLVLLVFVGVDSVVTPRREQA